MKTLIAFASLLLVASLYAADFVITPSRVIFVSPCKTAAGCSGTYCWAAFYTNAPAGQWGWALDTNSVTHTATDTNGVFAKVNWGNNFGPSGCGTNTVSIVPNQFYGPYYRFAVYGTNSVASSNLTLHGFVQ